MAYTRSQGRSKGFEGFSLAVEDSPCFAGRALEWHPMGIRMRTRSAFEVGVELALSLKTPEGEVAVSGFVVECSPANDEPGTFDLTAFFDRVAGGRRTRNVGRVRGSAIP